MRVVLASASPRRRELLAQAGIDFLVCPSGIDEKITQKNPQPNQVVAELSRQKALDVAAGRSAGEIIVGADTVVSIDGVILGKPKSKQMAFDMLTRLQGREHHVFTGVTIVKKLEDGERVNSFVEDTEVFVRPMTEEEIWEYIETGEPMDKAGAYGIQGRFGVYIRGICGDYYNVVGLPIAGLYQRLKEIGMQDEDGKGAGQ